MNLADFKIVVSEVCERAIHETPEVVFEGEKYRLHITPAFSQSAKTDTVKCDLNIQLVKENSPDASPAILVAKISCKLSFHQIHAHLKDLEYNTHDKRFNAFKLPRFVFSHLMDVLRERKNAVISSMPLFAKHGVDFFDLNGFTFVTKSNAEDVATRGSATTDLIRIEPKNAKSRLLREHIVALLDVRRPELQVAGTCKLASLGK